MRVTVGMVIGQIGASHSIDEILADYSYLEREDILQARRGATPLGAQKSARSCWRRHEAAGRHEPVAALGRLLAAADIEAAHWSTLGANNAPDVLIMDYARTHDLDFGAILAVTHGAEPSVVQIRAQDVSPR